MKERVVIDDDNLVNYVDWVQTYLDKLHEITKERKHFMSVIVMYLHENQQANETNLRLLQKVVRDNLSLSEVESGLLGT